MFQQMLVKLAISNFMIFSLSVLSLLHVGRWIWEAL